jgi:NTE family protein
MSKHLPDRDRNGIALCLSGGGFRASLFHSGALRRLNELGALSQIDTFVSVSGGSIVNGVLATRWNDLKKSATDPAFTNFDEVVAEPIRFFCSTDLRTRILLWDRVNPIHWARLLSNDHSITDLLASAYADLLGLDVRLDTVKSTRTFIFCASNLESGVNWEFEVGPNPPARLGDYRTGQAPSGRVTIAQAVAASSAFPIAFPPLVLRFEDPAAFKGGAPDVPLESKRAIPLTDGGVYDNLGLEPVWKSHEIVMVSDAGAPFGMVENPGNDFVSRLTRCQGIVDNQSRSLRKRWLISMFLQGVMKGAYWGISGNHREYELAGSQGFEGAALELIGSVRTDLDAFSEGEIACLENHGYAMADTALRRWLAGSLQLADRPFAWPHAGFEPSQEERILQALEKSASRGILKDLWQSALDRLRV